MFFRYLFVLYFFLFLYTHSFLYGAMQPIYWPDNVLCAALLKEDRIAIGSKMCCYLFKLEKNTQKIFEKTLVREETVNLCINKDGTLLGITTSNPITNYIYNLTTDTLREIITLISLPHNISIRFLPDNRLVTFDSGTILIDSYDNNNQEHIGGVKYVSGQFVEQLTNNVSYHRTKNQFLCHNTHHLYKVHYNEDFPIISATAKEISTQVSHYEDVQWDSSTHNIVIRDVKGKIFIGTLSKNYLILPVVPIGITENNYINMCFYPRWKNILILLTDKGSLEYWNSTTKELIMEKEPIKKDNGFSLGRLMSSTISYFFPHNSSLVFDHNAENILVIFNDKLFIGNISFSDLLCGSHDAIKYILLSLYCDRSFIPKDIYSLIVKVLVKDIYEKNVLET